MNNKALHTLEYPKIIDRLVDYADFSASADLARRLTPTPDLEEAKLRQAATREARHILSLDADVSFQMAQDIRPLVGLAQRDGVLEPGDLLAIRNTLIVARTIRRTLENVAADAPHLSAWWTGCRWGWGWWIGSARRSRTAARCRIRPLRNWVRSAGR